MLGQNGTSPILAQKKLEICRAALSDGILYSTGSVVAWGHDGEASIAYK